MSSPNTTGAVDPARIREHNEARCRRLLARSELLFVDDLGWETVGSVELGPEIVQTLIYMRDVEGFTSSYLDGLGAHKTTLGDPIVSAFLEVWESEEAGHATAIQRYLETYAERTGGEITPPAAANPPSPRWPERLLARTGGPLGDVVAAAHMAWGATNELLTMNGYRLLARQTADPVLAELLRRIAAQESRHYSFYLLQAEWRLAASRTSRVILPRILRDGWTPVGVGEGYKTADEFAHVFRTIGARPDGLATLDRMDNRIAALPGLSGLRIFRSTAEALAA